VAAEQMGDDGAWERWERRWQSNERTRGAWGRLLTDQKRETREVLSIR